MGLGIFPQDFLPIKIIFFFSQSESQNIFFRSKQNKISFFFSKQHICSKCILLDLNVRVFLESNIHGYIVYMFVYICILDIWVRVYMSRDMTKLTKWLCAQRRLRSAKPPPHPPPPPPRSQRHLEISNKMESFPSYGSRIFFFVIFEAILFSSTSLEPYAICEQQRHRSACASAPRSLISTFIVRCLDSMIFLVSILAIL